MTDKEKQIFLKLVEDLNQLQMHALDNNFRLTADSIGSTLMVLAEEFAAKTNVEVKKNEDHFPGF